VQGARRLYASTGGLEAIHSRWDAYGRALPSGPDSRDYVEEFRLQAAGLTAGGIFAVISKNAENSLVRYSCGKLFLVSGDNTRRAPDSAGSIFQV
jgi:hypothetical protein